MSRKPKVMSKKRLGDAKPRKNLGGRPRTNPDGLVDVLPDMKRQEKKIRFKNQK